MRLVITFLALAAVIPVLGAQQAPDFVRDIQPIFARQCQVCHGAQMQLAGLRLDDRAAAMRVIKPGDAAASKLVRMVTGADGKFMPPSGPHLADNQIALLRSWIDS